ncbi:MAG: CsgG/HfaB family protein [Bacteroidales bacterium]|nr:CsgG/HfaB family protein [Bacteroidales bacterium]
MTKVNAINAATIGSEVIAEINCKSGMESRDHSNGVSPKNQRSRGNKRCLTIFVCLFFWGVFSTYAQDSKLRIAVLNIHSTELLMVAGNNPAKEITSILTTELVNTNKFRVAERTRIEQIMQELGLQSTQDASVQAAEIGKLLGVHKIITGEYSKRSTSIRLIDVESGDIEKAITVKNSRSSYKTAKNLCEQLMK